MKLQITFTRREIEDLRAMTDAAGADAEAMISEDQDSNQRKTGLQIERAVALVHELIHLANVKG